ARWAVVEVAGQARGWLVGNQMQFAVGFRRAEPFSGLDPHRMAGAVLVTERGNLFGEYLEPSRRRAQRFAIRSGPLGGQEMLMNRHRIDDVARVPKRCEVRPLDAVAGGLLACYLVGMVKPLHLVAAFSEAFFFQAEDGIRYWSVTGVQTCALPI